MDEMVVSSAQRSTGDRMVCLPNCAITVIKNVHTPSGACDLLSVFGENPAQMSLIEIPKAHSESVRVSTFHPRQLFRQCVLSCGDVSLRRNVNTDEEERVELTGGIEWATEYEESFNVNRTVLMQHCHVGTPAIVHKE